MIDLKRLRDEGYEIEVRHGFLVAHSVPYVNAQKRVALGKIVTDLTLNNDKTETIAVDHHREIKLNLSETVEKNQTVTIGSHSVTMIKQNEQPTVKGSRTDSVGGSETVKVKAE